MTLYYALLTYFMAAFNLYRGVNSGVTMNFIMALLWLGIGIFYTVKYIKQKKKSKRKE